MHVTFLRRFRRHNNATATLCTLAMIAGLATMPLPVSAQVQAPPGAPARPMPAEIPASAAPAASAPLAPQAQAAASAPAAALSSAMDGRLFYQLLVAEMALNAGDTSGAFELTLDAATRLADEDLFRRAVDIALRARAGERALEAAKAWRTALPTSLDAVRLQLQVLLVLNRPEAMAEPLNALLSRAPEADRPGLITALPRFLQRASKPRLVAAMIEDALQPYREAPATRGPVRVTVARAWLDAKDYDRALKQVQDAVALDPSALPPVYMALELMSQAPEAEALVGSYLSGHNAQAPVRLAYVRVLTGLQRYADAVAQLKIVTDKQPELAPAFLSLGALQLELKHPQEGEAALKRYVELVQQQVDKAQPETKEPTGPAAENDDADTASSPGRGLIQAWLMLAQSAEMRGDYAGAEAWLAKIDDPGRALDVQTRRASILVRQGRIDEARALIRGVPERQAADGRAKLVAEASVLREAQKWREAHEVLAQANERFSGDADLLYQQAMMAEKIDQPDSMERLLRRVIALKPDSANAYNALGYSLADRRVRLEEARELIQRALLLTPNDPFITDSLGWVEFRLDNRPAALEMLRRAYSMRPDPEIAAHLGEVLWADGQRDEARRIWGEGKVRDAANDVLRETLARLRVDL